MAHDMCVGVCALYRAGTGVAAGQNHVCEHFSALPALGLRVPQNQTATRGHRTGAQKQGAPAPSITGQVPPLMTGLNSL